MQVKNMLIAVIAISSTSIMAQNAKKDFLVASPIAMQVMEPSKKQFKASDHFRIDNEQAKICSVSKEFSRLYLPKVESSTVGGGLIFYKVARETTDDRIIATLKERNRIEVTLADVYAFIQRPIPREFFAPATVRLGWKDSLTTVLYVRDAKEQLHTVVLKWNECGYSIDATDNLIRPKGMMPALQVVEKNPDVMRRTYGDRVAVYLK